MNIATVLPLLRKQVAEAAANFGTDGTTLTEKRAASSAFLKALAKRSGLSVGKNRDSLEKIAGNIRWHGSGATARMSKKGKKKG